LLEGSCARPFVVSWWKADFVRADGHIVSNAAIDIPHVGSNVARRRRLFLTFLVLVAVLAGLAWGGWKLWTRDTRFYTYQTLPLGDEMDLRVRVMINDDGPDFMYAQVRRGGHVLVDRAHFGSKRWDGFHVNFQIRPVAGRYVGLYVEGYPKFLLFVYDPQTGEHWEWVTASPGADRIAAEVKDAEGKPWPLLVELDWLWARFLETGQPSP
jgi:hypothetical protein